jgi:hypothetical protein
VRYSLVVTADVPSSLILSKLKMQAKRFSESSVLKRWTRSHFPETGILYRSVFGDVVNIQSGWLLAHSRFEPHTY